MPGNEPVLHRRDAVRTIGLAGAGLAAGATLPASAASSPQNQDVLSVMKSHRSIRQYEDEPLSEIDLRRAVEAAQMAATSSNVQAYALLQITDRAKRDRLVTLTGNQPMVAQAGAFFVILGDTRRHRLIAQDLGRPYDARLEAFMLAVIDASLFAQNLVLAFESMGYGTCYIGGLRNRLPEADALLNLPQYVYPLYGLCVGRPAQDPATRPRLPFGAICFQDAYPDDDTMRAEIAAYDETMRRYYRERAGSDRNWSTGIAQLFSAPARSELADYYKAKGARLE